MNRATTQDLEIGAATDERLRFSLLTPDGKGTNWKTAALDELLRRSAKRVSGLEKSLKQLRTNIEVDREIAADRSSQGKDSHP